MYGVKCPKCSRLLKLALPVENARLKCRGCGAVFVGSTEIMADPVGPAPPAPHAAHPAAAHHPPHRRKKSPVGLIVVLVLTGVGVPFGGYAIWYYSTHHYYEFRDEYGQIQVSGRFTTQEGERLQAKYKQEAEEREAARDRDLLARRGVEPGGTPGGTSSGGGSEPSGPVRPVRALVKVPPADPQVTVAVAYSPGQEDALGQGVICGTVTNHHAETIALAQVCVAFYDAEGQALLLRTTEMRILPTGLAVPFSVRYRKPEVPIDKIAGLASEVRRDASMLACEVARNEVLTSPEPAGTVVILKGKTVNRTGQDLRDVKVRCDFFNAQGELLDSAEGTVETLEGKPATGLRAGQRAMFTVRLDAGDKEYLVDAVKDFHLRLYGRKL